MATRFVKCSECHKREECETGYYSEDKSDGCENYRMFEAIGDISWMIDESEEEFYDHEN